MFFNRTNALRSSRSGGFQIGYFSFFSNLGFRRVNWTSLFSSFVARLFSTNSISRLFTDRKNATVIDPTEFNNTAVLQDNHMFHNPYPVILTRPISALNLQAKHVLPFWCATGAVFSKTSGVVQQRSIGDKNSNPEQSKPHSSYGFSAFHPFCEKCNHLAMELLRMHFRPSSKEPIIQTTLKNRLCLP